MSLFGDEGFEGGAELAPIKPWTSPSRLRTWRECPRKYAFQHVEKRPTRPSPHFDLGSNVHAALRDWLRLPPAARTVESLLELHREAWRANRPAFARRSRDELREWGERGVSMLRRFADTVEPGLEPVAIEMSVRVDLGDVVVGGRVDRVDELPDGSLRIVDYKTGRFPTNPEKARAEDLAAAVYARGASDAFVGAPVSTVEYLHLMTMDRLRFEVEPEWLEQSMGGVEQLARESRAAETSGEFPPRPSRACRWCDFTALCPAGRAFLDGAGGRR